MSCHHPSKSECRNRLEQLRALDFAIQETVLYLDAYPEQPDALQFYHALLEQRHALMQEYENQCGPLTIYGNKSRNSWDWTNGPWPWEADAN